MIDPENNIRSLDKRQLTENTHNIYMTVVALGKQANYLAHKTKAELNEKLAEFSPPPDLVDEVVENREQIEIAKIYEAMPKPTLMAIDDWEEGRVHHTNPVD